MRAEIARWSVTEFSARIAARDISRVEAAHACLSALATQGPGLNCLARLEADTALTQAAAGDARQTSFGVPMAHKDMFARTGWKQECGSRAMRDYVATHTATVLTKLDAAGAIDLGRLAMGEFAIGASGHNDYAGTPRNPWHRDHLAGGTSGGPAAAVAARLVPAALASDTGGSTRLPAAFCGIAGFKPSFGKLDTDGMFPCSPTLDHVGILARDAADIALVFAALTSIKPPRPNDLRGARIGVQRRYFLDGCAGDVSASFDAALRLLEREGAALIDVDAPDVEAANPLASLVIMVEAASHHRRRLDERAHDYLSATRARLATGFVYTGAEYRAALAARVHFLRHLGAHVFAQADFLITPTAPRTAPRIDGADLPGEAGFAGFGGPIGQCARLFNMTGLPAIAVPFGFAANGMPLSIQFVARPNADAALLTFATAFEAARGPYPSPDDRRKP